MGGLVACADVAMGGAGPECEFESVHLTIRLVRATATPLDLSARALILETPLAQEQFFKVLEMAHQNLSSSPQHICIFCEVKMIVREDRKADEQEDGEGSEPEERSRRRESK